MDDLIGAHHEFHDEEFAAGWATRFAPTPERLELFNVILSELKTRAPLQGCIVELGIGPGYLADHLLNAMPGIRYCGLDFSIPMLRIARQRLRPYAPRLVLAQADLIHDEWWTRVPESVAAFVSTWALHDLGSPEHVERVYAACQKALPSGGVLLNGDFIKPDGAHHEYEPGRFEIARHIELLRRVGFESAECLVVLEEEIEAPTAAQNYACIKGVV